MKTLTLLTGTWLFVKVPKGADDITTNNSQDNRYQLYEFEDLPPGRWQIFSLASAMTEELAAQMCNVFLNHLNQFSSDPYKAFCDTALESFATLMAAHEMYTKNPLGEGPEREGKKDLHYIEAGIRNLKFNNRVDEWQSYESKVSEYIILKEVK